MTMVPVMIRHGCSGVMQQLPALLPPSYREKYLVHACTRPRVHCTTTRACNRRLRYSRRAVLVHNPVSRCALLPVSERCPFRSAANRVARSLRQSCCPFAARAANRAPCFTPLAVNRAPVCAGVRRRERRVSIRRRTRARPTRSPTAQRPSLDVMQLSGMQLTSIRYGMRLTSTMRLTSIRCGSLRYDAPHWGCSLTTPCNSLPLVPGRASISRCLIRGLCYVWALLLVCGGLFSLKHTLPPVATPLASRRTVLAWDGSAWYCHCDCRVILFRYLLCVLL